MNLNLALTNSSSSENCITVKLVDTTKQPLTGNRIQAGTNLMYHLVWQVCYITDCKWALNLMTVRN